MKQTISKSDFRDAFFRTGRKDNFSYEALGELYDHLEEVCEDYDLDVVELCCDYMEDRIENVLASYNLESLDALKDATCVIWHDEDTVLFQQF